jgi:GH24 family phage-related lysozyme (muramidase)
MVNGRSLMATYRGEEAVKQAINHYKPESVSHIARHIIHEEGFVTGKYDDHKGVETAGVGATRENIGKDFFREVLPKYEKRAADTTKDFAMLPQNVQAAVVSMAYRGDWGPKTKALLKEGKWFEAAAEYLTHKEYFKGKKEGASRAEKAVSARMERNASHLRMMDTIERTAKQAKTFPSAL